MAPPTVGGKTGPSPPRPYFHVLLLPLALHLTCRAHITTSVTRSALLFQDYPYLSARTDPPCYVDLEFGQMTIPWEFRFEKKALAKKTRILSKTPVEAVILVPSSFVPRPRSAFYGLSRLRENAVKSLLKPSANTPSWGDFCSRTAPLEETQTTWQFDTAVIDGRAGLVTAA